MGKSVFRSEFLSKSKNIEFSYVTLNILYKSLFTFGICQEQSLFLIIIIFSTQLVLTSDIIVIFLNIFDDILQLYNNFLNLII